METDRPRCSHCNEILGVYEPIVIVDEHGRTTATSLVATPDAACVGTLLHANCHGEQPGAGRS